MHDDAERSPLFVPVPARPDAPELERAVIRFWNERDVFRASLEKPAPAGDWVFYEGPPTANGKPGVHHVIARAFKDLFPRFRTMQGHRVERKGGWDTHGLPVEIAIEKRLGFESKQEIERYGIEAFNALCKEYVFENIQDWNAMTERIGYWLDLENAYVTYTNAYIESCWWVFSELFRRGLLEEDFKTTWHSPSSNTTLASHEVSLGYQEDVEDPSVTPAFPVDAKELRTRGLLPEGAEDLPLRILAWTTTPWTLPANTGLAVAAEATYALVRASARHGGDGPDHAFVLAADRVAATFEDDAHEVLATFVGRELEGIRYRPVLRGRFEGERAPDRRVVADPMVSLGDGTGVVHVAPAYGDLEMGRTHGLDTAYSVALTGEVLPEVAPLDHPEGEPGPYAGRWFKEADDAIARDLMAAGLMRRRGTIRHAYPMNWRDGTPLMNVAKRSWYIRTTAVKEKLLANNDRVGWVPDALRTGRFGKWLENNVDWAISRERYWGCPLPIWESEDGSDRICVGSVAELSELAGRDLGDLDLHRPAVDEVVFEVGGVTYRREPYTVDVWFESGAMPYAQWHYTGQDGPAADALRSHFPADYICEAIDQTRGWFYSLHALATLLTHDGSDDLPRGPLADMAANTSSFKNVIVLGHIVDEKGEKMSKSKGNVVDPFTVLDAYGADALRWYLYASSPPEATKRFSTALVEETQRDLFATLSNTHGFFTLYANLDRPDLHAAVDGAYTLGDRWLASRREALTRDVTAALEGFDPTGAARAIRDFVVDDLSNWYVRRNRRRFWRGDGGDDALAAYRSLYDALVRVATLMAPLAPYISERLWQDLVRRVDADAAVSVHLADWPEADVARIDDTLMRDVAVMQRLVELGRSARAASGHKVRQPLPEVLVRVRSDAERDGVARLEDQLRDELNVKRVRYLDLTDAFLDYDLKPNLPLIGKRLGKRIPALRAALATADPRAIASAVREGREVSFDLDGERVTLEPEALLLDARSPEGFAAVEDRGYLVALDTTLTPALVREGLARDAVRLVQDARKQAGLDVSDRIELWLRADDATAVQALTEHEATLRSETLAVALALGDAAPEDVFALSTTLGEGDVRIGLRRVSDRDTLP